MAATIAATSSGDASGEIDASFTMSTSLERNVAVLAGREHFALRAQHRERARQDLAGLARIDHVVDIPPLGRDVRVGEALGVLGDELGAPPLDVVGGLDLLAV